jgi:hypothetical protein
LPTTPFDALTVDSDTSAFTFVNGNNQNVMLFGQGRTVYAYGNSYWPSGSPRHWYSAGITPPTTEERFQAQRTYPAAGSANDTSGGLTVGGDGSGCTAGPGSTFTVHQADYDDAGALTALAYSYERICQYGPPERLLGDVRWASEVPYAALDYAPVSAGRVVIGQSLQRTAALTNAGTQPVSVSGLAIEGPGAADWRVITTDCVAALQPGQKCQAQVEVTPSQLGDRAASLRFTDDSARGWHVISLGVDVAAVSPPVNLRAVNLVDKVALRWEPGPGRAASGYKVRRGYSWAQLYDYRTLPAGSTDFVDDRAADAQALYYDVVAYPVGDGWAAASPLVQATTGARELVMTGAFTTDSRSVVAMSAPQSSDLWLVDDGPAVTSAVAMSPDGLDLAYSRGTDLWLGSTWLRSSSACETCVSGHPGSQPVWSPKDGHLAYVTPIGGLAQYVRAFRSATAIPGISYAAHPSFLPDGSGLVVADSRAGMPLRRVTLAGAVTPLAGTAGASAPAVSPRGDVVAFLVASPTGRDLRLLALNGPSTARTIASGGLRHLSWAPDGSTIVATRAATMGSEVVAINPATGAVGVLFTSAARIDSAVLRHQDVSAPTIKLNVPAYSTGKAAVAMTVTDDTYPVGSMQISCSLDGGAATVCKPPQWTRSVAAGRHTLTVTATAGYRTTSATASWTADTTIPVAKTTAPTASTIYGSTTTMGWTASDTGSGVGSYDVRYRSASDRAAAFSAFVYPSTWQRIARSSQTLAVAAGTEYCVSVRARDRAGNTGGWSAERCLARPLDDRSLSAATSGWTRGTRSGYYASTWTRTGSNGARLSRTSTQARRVALLVTTCPTCGTAEVWVGSTKIGTVSTASSTTHYQVLKTLPLQAATRTGTLTIKNVTSGRPLYIDGVLMRRT